MEIKTFNSAQLNELIESKAFALMPVIPISTHRAVSHIHNPRADKEDVLMIIAYEGNAMVGYLGVLADRVYNENNVAFKCGWLSCMWVNPVLRGQGIAKQLLATAFRAWNNHILVTEFTAEAKGLYDRSEGFSDLRINKGLRGYMRFNLHEVLPKKNEKYKPYTSILKVIDTVANLPVDVALSLKRKSKPTSLIYERVTEIDKELNEYISSKQTNSFERREADELNWMLNYPWLKESVPTDESRRYHFSSVADRFRNVCFKLIDSGEIKGFLQLTIRDNHLKIPYAYYDQKYIGILAAFIYQFMKENRLNMLTIFHRELVDFIQSNSNPFIYTRNIKRTYIISKVLDRHFADHEKIIIQDGDADCAFT